MVRFSGFYRLGLALLAVAIISMAANAQPPRGGPGGQGGQGGPGMRRGPGGGGPGGGLLGMLRNPQVQEELELTEDQINKLRDAQRKAMESMRGDGGGFDREAFRNMSEDERRAQFEKMRAQMEKVSEQVLAEVLVPEQKKRLEQIALQQQGTQALLNKKVINALKLTAEQQAELKTIGEETRSQMMEIFQGMGRDSTEEQRTQAREKATEIRKSAEKKAIAVLTDDQKQALGELMGKPFQLRRFEGRRPGGNSGNRDRRGDATLAADRVAANPTTIKSNLTFQTPVVW